MSNYIPHVEDSDAMNDIHSRMTGLIERMIPMNMHDSNWLCDGVIAFQDEPYVCGRKRGALECNAELLSLLQDALTSFADSVEGGEADEWVRFSRAAIAKAADPAHLGVEKQA